MGYIESMHPLWSDAPTLKEIPISKVEHHADISLVMHQLKKQCNNSSFFKFNINKFVRVFRLKSSLNYK